MYVCKYCLRNLKMRYETCPGCGASQFEEIRNYREKVIKDPPFGGYKINLKDFEHDSSIGKVFFAAGILFAVVLFLFIIFSMFGGYWGIELLMLVLPLFGFAALFLYEGSRRVNEAKQEIDMIQKLSKTGMLIKNLEYEIVTLGANVNEPLYKIRVFYKNQSGIKVPFISNIKYTSALTGSTGTADLLVNPNNFSEYYIDFEIF